MASDNRGGTQRPPDVYLPTHFPPPYANSKPESQSQATSQNSRIAILPMQKDPSVGSAPEIPQGRLPEACMISPRHITSRTEENTSSTYGTVEAPTTSCPVHSAPISDLEADTTLKTASLPTAVALFSSEASKLAFADAGDKLGGEDVATSNPVDASLRAQNREKITAPVKPLEDQANTTLPSERISNSAKATRPNTTSPPTSKARPKAHMNFLIIRRKPRFICTLWPEGKVQGVSLSEFVAAVATATRRSNITKLELTLETEFLITRIPVEERNEETWLLAKRKFNERLKEDRTEAKLRGLTDALAVDLNIEPLFIKSIMTEEDDEDLF